MKAGSIACCGIGRVELSCFAGFGVGGEGDEIVEHDGLGIDEAAPGVAFFPTRCHPNNLKTTSGVSALMGERR